MFSFARSENYKADSIWCTSRPVFFDASNPPLSPSTKPSRPYNPNYDMSGDNPFAQWGGERDQPNLSPSIYGALPLGQSTPVPYNLPGRYASSSTNASSSSASSGGNSQLQIMSFRFVSPARTILNSTLMGADGKKYFTIATHAIGNTVVVNEQAGGNGEAGGSIEWQRYPIVSLMDIVARQTAKQWLALSADKRYRSMTLRGQQYSWVPSTGMICVSLVSSVDDANGLKC
ncbi:hypothetical protein CC2G_013715 [Coprinopsis cinerea AmutBmut pab1-1]|nr:hypothetical protein CC2G_013715 [Coprinopsis cinerea AmutBmut pab1-1]